MIKKVDTNKNCEWCLTDLNEKHKASYVIVEDKAKEYICKGHYDYTQESKDTIDTIKDGFFGLKPRKQVSILLAYTAYVANYPDDHDESSYPASFWEWYSNDFDPEFYGIA